MKIKNDKIAIIADVHCQYPLLTKVLENIKNRNINEIVFLGDYVTDGFENNKVVDEIKKYQHVIAGNRDMDIAFYDGISWEKSDQYKNMLYAYNDLTKENINYLQSLPIVKIVVINNKKICLSHGSPYNVRDTVNKESYELFDKLIIDFNADIYLFGHTHRSFYKDYKGKIFINPGSLALSDESTSCKYGILDTETLECEMVEISYDFEEIKNYYLNSNYFSENYIWGNLLLHIYKDSKLKNVGKDHCCAFIDFIINKSINENIDISDGFSNDLWNESFEQFVKENHLEIYK